MADTLFGIKLEGQNRLRLLIAALGIVAVGCYLWGDEGLVTPTTELAAAAPDSANPDAPANANPRRRGGPKTPNTAKKTREWPRLDPAEAMKHNPFTLSEDAAEQLSLQPGKEKDGPTEEELAAMERQKLRDQLLDELRRTGVSMIFRSSNVNVAVIGKRTLREGQIIDGVRVVSISNTGITVEPVD